MNDEYNVAILVFVAFVFLIYTAISQSTQKKVNLGKRKLSQIAV